MKKQYTITEKNRHEGETFLYVLDLEDSEAEVIKSKLHLGNNTLHIQETTFDEKTVGDLNRSIDNGYMDYIGFYELKKNALEKWEEFGDCFYKGCGLNRIKK